MVTCLMGQRRRQRKHPRPSMHLFRGLPPGGGEKKGRSIRREDKKRAPVLSLHSRRKGADLRGLHNGRQNWVHIRHRQPGE